MKRFSAFILAAALAAAFAAPVSAAYYEAFERPDTPFADMAYTGVDAEAADAFCARFLRDPVGLYPALVALYDEAYTQNELAYIAMCQNAGDAALSARCEQSDADFARVSDAVYLALSEALDGPQGGALRALMPEGEADAFAGYVPYSDDALAAASEENRLIQQYFLLPDGSGFADAAAELYLRLAALRRDEARRAGYNSYSEYAYVTSYAREYMPEDARELQRVVKSRIAPLYVRSVLALDAAGAAWDEEDVPSGEEVLDAVGAHIGEVSPELTEAFDFLRRNRLYCIGDGDELADMGYTTSLPAYRSAFLFNKAGTRYDAFESTVHEFGHFNAAYHDPTPMLYQYNDMDISEVQSQGLEMLFLPALQDILAGGSPEGRGIVALTVVSDMLGSVVDGCLYDEFEQAVFAAPDMTAAELHALEQRLYAEYGLDVIYGSDPYWVYVPHLFEQPCYYISYAASALPALDLWCRSLDDRASATDAYMRISAVRTDAWFLDMLYDSGLCDITSRGDVIRLADELEIRVGALLGELPASRSQTAVWIAAGGVAIVLVCAGLAIRRKKSHTDFKSERDLPYAHIDLEKTE